MSITFSMNSNPWERLPALAKRLGVEPVERANGIVISVDGKMYNVYDLVNAFLNIVDTHTPPTADIIQFPKKE